MKSNEENSYKFPGMSKVRLSLSTYVYVCLCMCIYMSIYLYTLEDKMENCIEQMSKETTNINYDPPDNSQSSITKPRIGKIYEMATINILRIQ